MNQIVPQVMIGNCLSSNDEDYIPSWKCFDTWVIQAQYFWQDCNEEPRVMCGDLVHVEPGEEIKTCIRYDHKTGSITVSIAIMKEDERGDGRDSVTKAEDHKRRSKIVVDRPFPHKHTHFESWMDFFEKCISAECEVKAKKKEEKGNGEEEVQSNSNEIDESGCLARPYLNIEYKGRVSVETLQSVCPLEVKEASFPGFTSKNWRKYLFCPRTGDTDTLDGLEENDSLHIDDAIILSK